MKSVRRARPGGIAEFYPFKTRREMTAAIRDANHLVKHALRTGDLVRQPCFCGSTRAEAHHDNYAKPLDVTWLCRHHHRQRDAELREVRRANQDHLESLPVAYLKRQARLQHAPYTAPKVTVTTRVSKVAEGCTIALVVQATSAIADLMVAESVNENRIARRLHCSRQLVNQNFAGGFRTLKVVAAYADALGYDASVVFAKRAEAVSA